MVTTGNTLRARYAEAFRDHFGGASQCTPGFADTLAGVAGSVRDAELERATRELKALKRAHVALAMQAGRDQARLAEIHTLAEREHTP